MIDNDLGKDFDSPVSKTGPYAEEGFWGLKPPGEGSKEKTTFAANCARKSRFSCFETPVYINKYINIICVFQEILIVIFVQPISTRAYPN